MCVCVWGAAAAAAQAVFEHAVGEGDIWRMCQTKDVAVRDWVRLAVDRARQSKVARPPRPPRPPASYWTGVRFDQHPV